MKLYWRVKINGKWNWRPVVVHYFLRDMSDMTARVKVDQYQEEDEDGR